MMARRKRGEIQFLNCLCTSKGGLRLLNIFDMHNESNKEQKRLETAKEMAGILLAKFDHLYDWEINFFLEALDEMYFSFIQTEFSDDKDDRSGCTFAYRELRSVLQELNDYNRKHLKKLIQLVKQMPCTETP